MSGRILYVVAVGAVIVLGAVAFALLNGARA